MTGLALDVEERVVQEGRRAAEQRGVLRRRGRWRRLVLRLALVLAAAGAVAVAVAAHGGRQRHRYLRYAQLAICCDKSDLFESS